MEVLLCWLYTEDRYLVSYDQRAQYLCQCRCGFILLCKPLHKLHVATPWASKEQVTSILTAGAKQDSRYNGKWPVYPGGTAYSASLTTSRIFTSQLASLSKYFTTSTWPPHAARNTGVQLYCIYQKKRVGTRMMSTFTAFGVCGQDS